MILITGSTGYIGSHIVLELLNENFDIIGIDNLSNSNIEVNNIIYEITKKEYKFYNGDMNDIKILEQIFNENKITKVIHLAGYKSVSESIKNPIMYYKNNINIMLNLLEIMEKYKCYNLIFSSSSTVYGENNYPVSEESKTGDGIMNPYGKTKYIIEEILKDVYDKNNNWNITILRYFNPIGSHKLLKENPKNMSSNLFPILVKVYNGELEKLTIYGNDYETTDGTCYRDYISVQDVANAHIKCLDNNKLKIYNIGTGNATSIFELITKFEKINNTKIKYEIAEKRIGDLPITYANVEKIKKEKNWSAKYDIEEMIKIERTDK